MYTVEHYETTIPVSEYLENFVDIPTFLEACKACPNYGQVWSCPPYNFNVTEYWNRYATLHLFASKIIFDEASTSRVYTKKELDTLLQNVLFSEKKQLSDALLQLETEIPGSISLSAGSCQTCRGCCTKPNGLPCRHPETMRYSLESLGGNVGLTVTKQFGFYLEWMENGRLPHHFVLVSGLLMK